MLVPDVLLQHHGVREHPWAILTGVALVLAMKGLVLDEVGSPGEGAGAVVTAILASSVAMSCHQVLVQPAGETSGEIVSFWAS